MKNFPIFMDIVGRDLAIVGHNYVVSGLLNIFIIYKWFFIEKKSYINISQKVVIYTYLFYVTSCIIVIFIDGQLLNE